MSLHAAFYIILESVEFGFSVSWGLIKDVSCGESDVCYELGQMYMMRFNEMFGIIFKRMCIIIKLNVFFIQMCVIKFSGMLRMKYKRMCVSISLKEMFIVLVNRMENKYEL